MTNCPECNNKAEDHDYNTWYCAKCKIWFFIDPFIAKFKKHWGDAEPVPFIEFLAETIQNYNNNIGL